MTNIAIIVGSTRPGRRGRAVAEWAHTAANRHPVVREGAASVDLVDLTEQDLPLLNEPVAAMFGQYRHSHTQRWAATIARYDGFFFVTSEYNRSVPAALKNAVDYLFAEWSHKAAGLISYGVSGGVRAAEHLRLVLAAVNVATVPGQLALSVATDFEPFAPTDLDTPRVLTTPERHEAALGNMLEEVIAWSGALRELRIAQAAMD